MILNITQKFIFLFEGGTNEEDGWGWSLDMVKNRLECHNCGGKGHIIFLAQHFFWVVSIS